MEYDYNGLRLRKGNKKYFWHGNTLKAECWEEDGLTHYIYFYYDESGVCGMLYHNLEYHFRKNVFGDIIAIYDAYGYKVCSYVYDAWGKHKISGVNQTIGRINPFRYRGYYYDQEFGLYYMQSRYYDPEVGRFISADDVSYLNPQSIFGLNLYAYCNNNPVMYTDPTGTTAWWEWFLLGVAAVVVTGAAIVATVATGGVALVAGGIAIGGALGCLTSIVGQGATNSWDNISVGGIAMGALVGSALGGLGGAAFGGAGAGAGVFALAGGGSVSTGTAVVGVAGALGLSVWFSKGFGPRMGHNQYEKQMWDEATRRTGINKDKDLMRRVHNKLRKYPYNDTLDELVNCILDILSKIMY